MKPSKIIMPKAKKAWLLLPDFKAVTWKGVIYCRKQDNVDSINKNGAIDSSFKSHETIHVRQAQSMKDSWTRFYLNYIWNWIKNIPLITVNVHAIYKLIPTEIEAYLYQDDWTYAENPQPVTRWKEFQKLTMKDKKTIAVLFYDVYKKKRTYSSILYDLFLANDDYVSS